MAVSRTGHDVASLLRILSKDTAKTARQLSNQLSERIGAPFSPQMVRYVAGRNGVALAGDTKVPPNQRGQGHLQQAVVGHMKLYLDLMGVPHDYDHAVHVIARLPLPQQQALVQEITAQVEDTQRKTLRDRLRDDLAIEQYYLTGLPVPDHRRMRERLAQQTDHGWARLRDADEVAMVPLAGDSTLILLDNQHGIWIRGGHMRVEPPLRVVSLLSETIAQGRRRLRHLEDRLRLMLVSKGE